MKVKVTWNAQTLLTEYCSQSETFITIIYKIFNQINTINHYYSSTKKKTIYLNQQNFFVL